MRKPGCDPSSPHTWVARTPNGAMQARSLKQGSTQTIINSTLGFLEDRGCSDEPTSFRLSPGSCDITTSPFSQENISCESGAPPGRQKGTPLPKKSFPSASTPFSGRQRGKSRQQQLSPQDACEGVTRPATLRAGGPDNGRHSHHQTQ